MGFSYANLANVSEIERLYEAYLADSSSVDPSWGYFFQGMELAREQPSRGGSSDARVFALVEAYRRYGHLKTRCNPIATSQREEPQELRLETLGFKPEDLSREGSSFGVIPQERCTLKELIAALEGIYCSEVGFEYMGIEEGELRSFLQKRIEGGWSATFSSEEKLEVLTYLRKAELFEAFLHTKYVGQTRFSLEGMETLIPLLALILDKGGSLGVQEAVLGMAHRGRLNVLATILNKSYTQIFHEFEEPHTLSLVEEDDVKYHKGFVGLFTTAQKTKIPVTLPANPSHLEGINPVVEGIARAKQDAHRINVLPILIHGDAAIAGQGIVYETLQLSCLEGYKTGGTVHIIANNQIGFTTSPHEFQSTKYCSAIAKAFNAPIFHVNAEDPLSCAAIGQLVIEVRERFATDVFINLNGYRKYGHNEGDEPNFTQPLEYALIRAKKSIYNLLCEKLVKEGILTEESAQQELGSFKQHLQEALARVQGESTSSSYDTVKLPSAINTCIAFPKLVKLAESLCVVPDGFRLHPKIKKLLQDRQAMLKEDPSTPTIDWGMAENLAFGSILEEKISVRLAGQDTRRGTFSHRHAVWVDQVDAHTYCPLSQLGKFQIYNSPLSEYAAMGFEFGYSLPETKTLVLWEAQYGDFADGAQIMIDEFIASSEQKWGVKSNLTLLLPHGYEGAGPDHSSARVERFLQLCGQNNLCVVTCSMPAQFFHCLREQALQPTKKPLILFTPKALLRHPLCVSSLDAFTKEGFLDVIDDKEAYRGASKVLLCTGRVYYDLFQEREKRNSKTTALVRIEKLYPFPEALLDKVLSGYAKKRQVCWVQEEPRNMGAWSFVEPYLKAYAPIACTRARSASPATASHSLHKKELQQLLNSAFEESS